MPFENIAQSQPSQEYSPNQEKKKTKQANKQKQPPHLPSILLLDL